jgi:hypothetical protein
MTITLTNKATERETPLIEYTSHEDVSVFVDPSELMTREIENDSQEVDALRRARQQAGTARALSREELERELDSRG